MKRIAIPVVLTLTLAGCAATADLPSNYTLDANQPEGLAVISTALSGIPMSQVIQYEYNIRAVPLNERQAVTVKPHFGSNTQHARWVASSEAWKEVALAAVVKGHNTPASPDIPNAGSPSGRLMTLRLPAGNYEFHSWKIRERGNYGEMEYAPKQSFSYRFSIRPGVATYLGRLHLTLDEQRTHRIAVENQNDHDLKIFKQKYPALGGALSIDILDIPS